MNPFVNAYRRYYRPHRGMLIASVFLSFLVCAGDGIVVGYISRYLIDEVLQVDKANTVLVNGAATSTALAKAPPPRVQLLQNELSYRKFLNGKYDPPVIHSRVDIRDSLNNCIAARTGKTASEKISLLFAMALLMVAVHLTTVCMSTWIRARQGITTKSVIFRLRRHIFEKLLRLQMSYHDQHHVGRLISRAVEDVRVLEMQTHNLIWQGLSLTGTLTVSCAVMFCINVKIALIVLATMPVFLVTSYFFRMKMRELTRLMRRDNSRLYGLATDQLSHPRVVKGFTREKREEIRFFHILADMFRRRRKIVLLRGGLSLICTCLSRGSMAVVLGYGAVLIWAGEMSLGYLLFLFGAASTMASPMTQLSGLMMDAQHI
ncbi:MAG: ABC transporter ATP-binding protein, partial [Planctomycetes bacterium]|nr:ABC transporter ATP-binding protein [Planctomycetota bacterium]